MTAKEIGLQAFASAFAVIEMERTAKTELYEEVARLRAANEELTRALDHLRIDRDMQLATLEEWVTRYAELASERELEAELKEIADDKE